MARILHVYFYTKIIGELKQDDDGEIVFTYAADWLENPEAIAISCSLPLRSQTFKRKECRPFFSGILPEENQRKLIARILGISANNDFSMLERIGGECAGAITFIPPDESYRPGQNSYHELTEEMLAKIIKELPYKPLLAGEAHVRLSLAGVQDKIAIYKNNKKIAIPLDSSPSTHIIKPNSDLYDGLIYNEAFCLHLAEIAGLSVAKAKIRKTENVEYLFIDRYDRKINEEIIERLHQEDFCQALGVVTEKKYQNEGGPSLKQCFDLLRTVSAVPVIDIEKLIDAVIFNVLIGNCDAHGKNFSLLYNNGIRLAPLYDLVSTRYYQELSPRMAMKIGGEYQIDKITIGHFECLAEEVGLSTPGVCNRVTKLAESTLKALDEMEAPNQVTEELVKLVKKRCGKFVL